MSKAKKKVKQTYFHDSWLKVDEYMQWLKKLPDDTQFGCTWCKPSHNVFKLGNMGERAIQSHMKSRKHEEAKKHHGEIKMFFQKHAPKSATTPSASSQDATTMLSSGESQDAVTISSSPASQDATASSAAESVNINTSADGSANSSLVDATNKVASKLQSTLTHGLRGSLVIKAEIIWVLHTVIKDHSNTSNDDISMTFRSMFPDDPLVANFTCGRDKTKYLINYGIGPWVKENLNKEIDDASFIVIGFDESLNKVTQTCQMDLNVRYWDPVDHKVKVRYYDSKFLGHSTNTDLLAHYNNGIMNIDSSRIVQVSMDGPAVNHLFYEKLIQHRADAEIMQLMISIGSCGLHIIHGAFKFAFEKTSWGMKQIIKGTFVILHDTPARRSDYIAITMSEVFPLFFCATRWVESKAPADRLIEIWPNIVKIVEFWLSLQKKKQPSGKSFESVKNAVEDPLTTAKLSFFSYVASILEPFLTKYQTAKPMIPYLYTDLSKIYKSLLQIIIKDDVLENCSGYKLPEIKINDDNMKEEKEFNIGFVTKKTIKELKKKDGVTEEQMNDFYENIKICIKALIQKLNERCNLRSVVVRTAVIFNPVMMVLAKIKSLKKFLGQLLEHLVSLKIIRAANCDKINDQYSCMKNDIEALSIDLKEFPEVRLDDFFYKRMLIHQKYPELSEVVSLILTLSHGNADVERGFSVNKGVQKDNLKETSIVNKRHVKDYMFSNDLQPYTVEITNELRKSCHQARTKYQQYLDEQKKSKTKASKDTAKEIISMEIEEIEGKISVLQRSTDTLNNKFEKIVMNTATMPNSEDVVVAINEATALKRKAIEQTDDIRKLTETVKAMQEKKSKM